MEFQDLTANFGKNLKTMYKEKTVQTNVCIECGDRISYGRSDKKFCCESCKNRYHNRQTQTSRHYRQKVKSSLERNYYILDSLRRTSLRNIPVADMKSMGFRFEYFTSYVKKQSKETFLCYDMKYCISGGVVTSISKVNAEI